MPRFRVLGYAICPHRFPQPIQQLILERVPRVVLVAPTIFAGFPPILLTR